MSYTHEMKLKMSDAEFKKALQKINLEVESLIESYEREINTPVNLPRYAIAWQDKLTYQQFREKYNTEPLLSHQLPQCHICTRFHTDDNPLFAYSYLEKGNDYRLIYRCQSGHGHDYGMILMDIQTGLEMHL